MKSATLAVALLIALSADTAVRHQYGTPTDTCDSDGRCIAVTEPSPDDSTNAREFQDGRVTFGPSRALNANANSSVGVVRSRKTGALARVGAAYAARFQAYIDDLETNYGVRVLFMGGTRPGRCSRSSEHPCGKALDVCQRRRGVVDPHCNLPNRVALGRIAASHGLFEGGRWCNSDYGHAQIDATVACAERRVRIVQQ